MTRERINDFKKIVLPSISKLLFDVNYEGQGKCDAEEFAKDFNEILDLAIKALEQEPRKITLEDVKGYCKPRCLTIISNELYYELTHPKIKALEQEPKTGDWIPVSERLPENTQPVLMTIRRMSNLYNHEPFITVGYISWNQTTWWCAHDGDCVRNKIEVLAWMPLPKSYESEET